MNLLRNPSDTRVVVTGIGTINPIGNTTDEFWENCLRGKSGVRTIRNFEIDDYPITIAGEVDLPDLSGYFPQKRMTRRLDRYAVLAHIAGCQAMNDSGLDVEHAPHRYGSIIGSGEGGIITKYENSRKIVREGMQAASPFFIIGGITNTAAGFFAKEWNLQGPSFAVTSACATGNHALGIATHLIQVGMADAIFAGGAEAPVYVTGIAAFGNMMALSERNDDPETASRPFDRSRDGFILSEGSAVLCLEELEHAKKRGAHIYAEIAGIGFTADAHDLVAPHPEGRGAAQSMSNALQLAGLNPGDIDLINAHATSTALGDISECKAIHKTFGDCASRVMVQSTKSLIGHSLGAAGVIEAVVSILTLERKVIHPTINQFEQDPEIDLNIVKDGPKEMKINHILSNGFGFGGQNAALIFSRFTG